MWKTLGLLCVVSASALPGPRIITTPEDVTYIEPAYTSEHWGLVDFAPVPAYPILQDKYVSGWVHAGLKPWDVFVWDRLVYLSQTQHANRIFVDVGANLGYFTLALASLGYDVVAFEPMSRNARKFSKSIFKNGFRNHVVLCQNAVTDLGGQTVSLQETEITNQGNSQISASDAGESVSSVTLSDMFTPGIGHLSALSTDAHIVKIDVEGLEAAVLLGARKWICSSVVEHIIIEFSEATRLNKAYPAKDMFLFMQKAGYSVADVAVGSEPIPYDALVAGKFDNVPPNLIFSLINENSTC